ncbi:MAG TPA: type II CAAX endopeptidase family protein [Saprospiraceae bacterium]|nr:type II CAAX endopeptidase family protein [Saprospiraceae bacterium]HMP14149.1 type II CAAX endopeptidase family protein [Saprospiraceae bacterium]
MEFSGESEQDNPVIPPFVVLMTLLLAVMASILLASVLTLGWARWQGVELISALQTLDETSARSARDFARIVNLLNHVATFTCSALLVAVLLARRAWGRFFSMQTWPDWRSLGLGIVFILSSFPIAQITYWLNHVLVMWLYERFQILGWAVSMEKTTNSMLKGLLVMEHPAELGLNLLVVAVAPALGEELLFRGILQKQLARLMRQPVFAIWLTALIFSAIHGQFLGFLPRVVLGAALGYLFYWSGNLWLPIVAHFVTNAMQVVAQYASGGQLAQTEVNAPSIGAWLLLLPAIALLLFIGYRLRLRNLPPTVT